MGRKNVLEVLQASTDLLRFCLHLGSFQMYSHVVHDRGLDLLSAYSLPLGLPWR